ncbi:MAG: hypothetical protein HQM09_00460 [Candidatus Riflebacteria bacterium]|nr:hypothetical protein [Candidatus Riflebacteria bacterium]
MHELLKDFRLLPTERLLLDGGDARIALDPSLALNKYGCSPIPDPGVAAFASSTASTISEPSFAAADRLRRRLATNIHNETHEALYTRELNRIRQELLYLCGVSDMHGLEIIFAASGTDLHLIAAQMVAGSELMPTLIIMTESDETGSDVSTALSGQHFSTRSALGFPTIEKTPIGGGNAIEVVTVPVRLANGNPRQPSAVNAEIETLVTGSAKRGQRVLLILIDLSKTGLISPDLGYVSALHRRLPETVDVLVDASQFRMAQSTLRAYLNQGFIVAMTGSKFVTGPAFSGALLIPSSVAVRLRGHRPSAALNLYSARADWPDNWAVAENLANIANFGLLLRWEAALEELRMFRSVPDAQVKSFLKAFADAVQNRLMSDPAFDPLPVSPIVRTPLIDASGWDHIPTIFSFLLYRPGPDHRKVHLSRDQTLQIYQSMQANLANGNGLPLPGLNGKPARLRCQLGQPAACGNRNGIPVSALRLCASARLIVEATSQNGAKASAVIHRALATLDTTALLVKCHNE